MNDDSAHAQQQCGEHYVQSELVQGTTFQSIVQWYTYMLENEIVKPLRN